ncbi:MAG: hypothetical protein NTV54_09870 [Ignavibacteriales bacterium]|nr:hypothetical protein [Ignavibacteriales bacterium]
MAEHTAIRREKTRSANIAKRVRKASDTQSHTAQMNGTQEESPVDLLRRAEEELSAGMYHEALLDADGFIKTCGANDRALCLRGISRMKYGIPQLFDLGVSDLEQAAAEGNSMASELLQRLGGVLAA